MQPLTLDMSAAGEMRLVDSGNRVSLEELRRTAADKFGDMAETVVDVR